MPMQDVIIFSCHQMGACCDPGKAPGFTQEMKRDLPSSPRGDDMVECVLVGNANGRRDGIINSEAACGDNGFSTVKD